MLFHPCYLCGFQIYPSFGGGIIEICAIRSKKWGSEARVCPNRGAFLCPRVGRKSIRPPNVPPKEGESPAIGRGQAFAIHGMAFCGAYATRPYHDGRKMIAFGACSAVLPEKIGSLWGRLWGGRWKMWRVFMSLGRNYPAQKLRGICSFKKDATFAPVTTAVVDIFLK